MPVFHSQFRVQASIEAVYAFHRDARNLPCIQPPYPRVLSLSCPPLLEPGDLVELELGPFPRQSWKARVEELHPPHGHPSRALIIDAALTAPFPFFRHRHAFEMEAMDTWIRDTIDFEPPYGRLGYLTLPLIHCVFALLFFYRRIRTRKLLEK